MILSVRLKCVLSFLVLQLIVSCSINRPISTNDEGQQKEQFRAAAYNIRVAAKVDEETGNGWSVRKKPVAEVILSHDFDIVGTQEGNDQQIKELSELLKDYDYVAHPYGGREGNAHNNATFYKRSRFSLVDSGVFWLSETPDTPSIGWDATDRRICQWVKFKDKSAGREFYVFNTHFYWRNHIAKEESGPLLVRKIREIAGGHPVICTGDFNSRPESPQIHAIKELLADAYDATHTPRSGVEGTGFPGGVFQGEPGARIDYVFVSDDFIVEDYKVLSDVYDDDRYPSDHLPVTSRLTWK